MEVRQLLLADMAMLANKRSAKGLSLKSSTSEYRIGQCLKSLDGYVGEGAEIDCLQVFSEGWLDGFCSSMLAQGLAESTATERCNRLVALCRLGIKNHLLPNIPVRPNGAEKEIEQLQSVAAKKDLERALSLFHYRKEKFATETDSDTRQELKMRTSALGYAILSVLLCGIGYKGIAALRKNDLKDSKLRLPMRGVEIELPEAILEIIDWFGQEDGASEYLLVPEGVSQQKIERMALAELSSMSLDFREGFAEPMTLWLDMALDAGLSPDDCRKIITGVFDKEKTDGALLEKAFGSVMKSLRYLGYKWYCVRCMGRAAGADKKDEQTRGEALLCTLREDVKLNPIDSFAPRDLKYRKRGGQTVAYVDRFLDTLLFIKVNYAQLEKVNRHLMSNRSGFIYGDKDSGNFRFAAIHEKEIELLRCVFTEKESRRLDTNADEAKKRLMGINVKINQGFYDGFEGKICRIKFDEENKVRKLVITFVVEGKKIEHTIEPEFVELVS